MSNQKIENNSSETSTPGEIGETEELKNNNFTICPNCGSSIEILSINENKIEYRCLNEKMKHTKDTKFTKTIEEYLSNMTKNKDNKFDEIKDKCHIKNHNLNNYVSYCLDCKCHLCNECLKSKEHINHRKSNVIEIQPIEEEIKLIKQVLDDLRKKKKNLEDKKKEKNEEIDKSLAKEIEEEENAYKRKKNDNKKKEKLEKEDNENKYLSDVENIKKEYEEKLKIRKNKYLEYNEKIIVKFKLIYEKLKAEFELKKKKLNENCELTKLNLGFMDKIKNNENMLKLNEIIYNTYDNYKNNYYNSMSINNLLLYYNKNTEINNKMREMLGNKYDIIINIRNKKFNEDIQKKLTEELNKTKEEENKKLDKKNKDLENRLNVLEENNRKLKEEKQRMNEIINKKIEELNKMNQELIKQNKELFKKNEILIKKINKYEKQINNYETEKKYMKEKDNKLEKDLNKSKEDFNEIKEENEKLKLNNFPEIYNEDRNKAIDLKSEVNFPNTEFNNVKNNSDPKNIKCSNDIINDSHSRCSLDNTFSVFKSIDNGFYLIYANKEKSIISYDLIKNKKIKEIKNAHENYITNFRYYFDNINHRDLILSISDKDNNLKLWNHNNWECLLNIKNINNGGDLDSACFLNNNNQLYILTSNERKDADPIKVYDFNGNKIKEIKDSNYNTFFIDTYYDNKSFNNYIITGNAGYVKSHNYNNNTIYHKYCDNDRGAHVSIVMKNNNKQIQLIESSYDGNIRIWNFDSGILLNKIKISEDKLYGICQWDNDYLFIGCSDKTIKLIDIKNRIIIKSLTGHNDFVFTIKKIKLPTYGECLISQGPFNNNFIKIWNYE